MSVWLVSSGRMTQEQMDDAVRKLHNHVCSAFDGGEANRICAAGPVTDSCRIRHEAQICAVVGALNGNASGLVALRDGGE